MYRFNQFRKIFLVIMISIIGFMPVSGSFAKTAKEAAMERLYLKKDIVNLIIMSGQYPFAEDAKSLILEGLKTGHFDLDAYDKKHGITAILAALYFHEPEWVVPFVRWGADVNKRSLSGVSPLMVVDAKLKKPRKRQEYLEVKQYLLSRGARY